MRKARMLAVVLLVPLVLLMEACAGVTARDKVLSPAVVAVWPDVKIDAEAGIASRDEPDSTKALRMERLTQFDEAIKRLGG